MVAASDFMYRTYMHLNSLYVPLKNKTYVEYGRHICYWLNMMYCFINGPNSWKSNIQTGHKYPDIGTPELMSRCLDTGA